MRAVKRSEPRRGNQQQAATAGSVRVRRKVDPASPPTTCDIKGVRVHFPFSPYNVQIAYMSKVMDALLQSENALLESPTGTGKTFCLLCACLAWQQAQKHELHKHELHMAAELVSQQQQQQQQQQQHNSQAHPPPTLPHPLPHPPPTTPAAAASLPVIIYASRTHSQLSQVVRELRHTRYRPTHAVLASREQMCVNPKVKKAASSAADINHDCNKLGKERKCRYRNGLEGFVPPANESQSAGNDTQPVMDLEELVAMGTTSKVCPFYYTRGQVEKAELILVPYNYLFDKDARETTLADVRWANAVVIFDEAHNLESFASDSASFDLSNADIAGCMNEVQRGVNYMHSMPDLNYDLKEDNLVLLLRAFEGLEHHIMDLGGKTAFGGEFMMEIFRKGAGITFANHLLFMEELRKVNDMIMDLRGTGATRGSPRLEHFVSCLKRVYGHQEEGRCLAKASSYRVHVSPKTPGEKTGRTISYWCFAPSLAMEELSSLNIRSILVTSGTLSPLSSYGMELGLPFPVTLENPHIIQPDQVHVRVIGKGVSGKQLSSSYERRQDGEYYSELGNTLTSLAKVIPAGMLVFFPSYSVMETCIERWGGPSLSRPKQTNGRNNFFAQRKKKDAPKKYSFPRVLPEYSSFVTNPKAPWRRLMAAKSIVLEPRSSADLADAMTEFKRLLDLPKSPGCILMGVCRGKISEGIDFSHDMSRAVIITGIPFPPSFDPKIKMKREYLDSAKASAASMAAANSVASRSAFGGGFSGASGTGGSSRLSGHDWYSQQAHRAVNQAIGRVIRNKTDYGAILLLDSRFGQQRNQEGLSKWVRPHVLNDEGFGSAVKGLASFYREASAHAKIRDESKPAAVEVVYDEERVSDDEGTVQKVAVISRDRTKIASQKADETRNEEAYVAPNRVVARLEVDAFARQKTQVARTASQQSSKLGTVRNFDAIFDPRKQKPSSAVAVKRRPAATIFMEKTRSLMNVREQSTIRKLIVATKQQGDQKDVKGFRRSASDIIDMVLKVEKHESPPIPNDERMLFLFLELVPPAYRRDFELIALQKLFETSGLGELCKENMSTVDLSRVSTAIVASLHLLWFQTDVSGSLFVQHAQVVVAAISRSERVVGQTMMRAFMRLLPKARHEITRRIFDEIDSTRRIQERRQKERSNVGESAIDMNRFLPSTAVNSKRVLGRIDGDQSNSRSGQIEMQPKPAPTANTAQSSRAALSSVASKGPPGKVQTRLNPYKKARTQVVPTNTDSSSQSIKTALSGSNPASKAKSLSSLLKTVEESDPYVRQKRPSAATAIQSNAPNGLACPVCSTDMPKPYIANCGHMACMRCWKDWLQRSETCPSCRAPTRLESIAMAVFRSDSGGAPAGNKSQAPIVAAAPHGSDGELELF